MNWYIEKIEDIRRLPPRYSCCGDDCAVCPRFLAETEEELRETAEFWHKAGWRDRVVAEEEIRCRGCGTRDSCAFMILSCMQDRQIDDCKRCPEYPCGKIADMLRRSDIREGQCRAVCGDPAEWEMLKRAFYEKRENLAIP